MCFNQIVQNACAEARKELDMGGPTRRRAPPVRPRRVPATRGSLVGPDTSADECTTTTTMRVRIPPDVNVPIREGLPAAAIAQDDGIVVLVGGAVLGRVGGETAEKIRRCIDRGYAFTGIVQQIDPENSTVSISLAGSESDTS